MKDRRVTAFERVLSRRRQLDRKLNSALAGLRGESQVLAETLEAHRGAANAHAAELAYHGGKIETMLCSASFRADDYLKLREFHAHASEQQAMLEAQAAQAAQALAAKETELCATRAQIVRNRARIDIYGKRRDALVKAVELAIEDAQDEETSESRRPRPML